MGNNVTPPAGNYVLTSALQLRNYVIADSSPTTRATATDLRYTSDAPGIDLA